MDALQKGLIWFEKTAFLSAKKIENLIPVSEKNILICHSNKKIHCYWDPTSGKIQKRKGESESEMREEFEKDLQNQFLSTNDEILDSSYMMDSPSFQPKIYFKSSGNQVIGDDELEEVLYDDFHLGDFLYQKFADGTMCMYIPREFFMFTSNPLRLFSLDPTRKRIDSYLLDSAFVYGKEKFAATMFQCFHSLKLFNEISDLFNIIMQYCVCFCWNKKKTFSFCLLIYPTNPPAVAFAFFVMTPNEKEADEFLLKGKSAAYLKKAAKIYEYNKKWRKASDCYSSIVALETDQKNEIGAAENLKLKAISLSKIDDKDCKNEALYCLSKASELYSKNNLFFQSARTLRDIAEICCDLKDYKTAVQHYENASKFFETENYEIESQQCLEEIAKIHSLQHQFRDAIEISERLIAKSVKHKVLCFMVKNYIYDAMLNRICLLRITEKKNENEKKEEIRKDLSKYLDLYPSFSPSYELKALSNIIENIEVTSPLLTKAVEKEKKMDPLLYRHKLYDFIVSNLKWYGWNNLSEKEKV